MRTKTFMQAALVAASMFALAPMAHAGGGVRVGTLTCDVSSGWGHIVSSNREMNCVYQPNGAHAETYHGRIMRYGLDVGHTNGGTLIWGVVAPTSNPGRTALEGNYGGVSADATVGVGAGAHLLVGGLDRSITLQPLSVEGNSGIALAAGVGQMTLRAG